MILFRRSVFCIAVAVVVLPVFPVSAADFGDPVFPCDLGEMDRAELIYEQFSRVYKLTEGPDEDTLVMNLNATYARAHLPFGPYTTIDFDAGVIGLEYGFFLGGGLRQLLFDGKWARLSGVAQVHYSRGIEDKPVGAGGQKYESDGTLIETEGALLLSHRFVVDEEHALIPYAGAALSRFTFNGFITEKDTREQYDLESRSEEVVGGVVGITFQLPGKSSLRAEGRYFGRVSFSLAAALAF